MRSTIGLRSLLSAGQSSSTTPNLVNHVLEQEGENPQNPQIPKSPKYLGMQKHEELLSLEQWVWVLKILKLKENFNGLWHKAAFFLNLF